MEAKNLIPTTIVLLTANAAFARHPGITRIDLQRHDFCVPGRELIQAVVALAPGVALPKRCTAR